jgi:hypothetical protein
MTDRAAWTGVARSRMGKNRSSLFKSFRPNERKFVQIQKNQRTETFRSAGLL